jgi:hypothetical protein
LTVPRVSPTRLRPLPWGRTTPPSPAPSDVSPHTAHAWGDAAVRCPRLPSEPHGCPCATSLALATFLHARIRLNEALATTILAVSAFGRPPRQAFACARALTTVTSSSLHVFESVSHPSAPLQQPVSLSPLSPFAIASSRRLNQPCLRAVCACDPAACGAGRADGRTAGRWLPVAQGGRQGSTRRRWKRPFDFPILMMFPYCCPMVDDTHTQLSHR